MMYPYRRRLVGPSPTPDESMAEYRGYTGYFGRYTVNEAENYVVHHIDATLNSGVVGTGGAACAATGARSVIAKASTTSTATRGAGVSRRTAAWCIGSGSAPTHRA